VLSITLPVQCDVVNVAVVASRVDGRSRTSRGKRKSHSRRTKVSVALARAAGATLVLGLVGVTIGKVSCWSGRVREKTTDCVYKTMCSYLHSDRIWFHAAHHAEGDAAVDLIDAIKHNISLKSRMVTVPLCAPMATRAFEAAKTDPRLCPIGSAGSQQSRVVGDWSDGFHDIQPET
jgi:hypothetical protein